MKLILALLLPLLFIQPVQALSLQNIKFANASTIAAPGTVTSQWFDIRHFHYVDFTVVASVGDGTFDIEYASDTAGLSLIADPTTSAFDSTQAASLTGAGVGKFYIRINVNCVTAPCTYSAWFTAKGQI